MRRVKPDMERLETIVGDLINGLRPLKFGPPVSHVYNPLEYARETYRQYFAKYAFSPKEAVFIGMNPGPWGMAQTGIPFGEINAVRDWMKINAPDRCWDLHAPEAKLAAPVYGGGLKVRFKPPIDFSGASLLPIIAPCSSSKTAAETARRTKSGPRSAIRWKRYVIRRCGERLNT